MSEMIRWNTGRQYTPQGQRMAAVPVGDNAVAFIDIDRMIDGIISTPTLPATEAGMQALVMQEYDHCRYSGLTAETWGLRKPLAEFAAGADESAEQQDKKAAPRPRG